jgi:hypothetical protein
MHSVLTVVGLRWGQCASPQVMKYIVVYVMRMRQVICGPVRSTLI